MRRLSLRLFIVTLLLITSAYAQAQELDETGLKLQKLFDEQIQTQKDFSTAEGAKLEYKGDLKVEKAQGYYAVTLPHLAIIYPDNSKFDVGMIAINAQPHDQDGRWKMSLAIPTPMTFYNAEGQESMTVSIGSQRSSGVYEEKLGYFSKLDSNFENMKIVGIKEKFQATIPSVRVIYDLAQKDDGLWSGPASFSMKNMTVDAKDQPGAITIGDITLSMEMFDYNPDDMAKYREMLAATLKEQEASPNAKTSPDMANNILKTLLAALGDGFTANYKIKDFAMKGSESAQFENLKIDTMQFGLDMRGLRQNKVDVNIRAGYDGLNVMPPLDTIPKLAPDHLKFDITLDDLPIEDLQKLGMQTAANAGANPQMAQMQAMGAAMQLPALLSNAGSQLKINNNTFGNDLYKVTLNGSIKPNMASQYMSEANLTATIRGFDEIAKSLTEQIQVGGPEAAQLQGVVAGLMMMKGFAEAKAAPDGQIEHVLNLVLSPQGQVTLNGQDIGALMGVPQPSNQDSKPLIAPKSAP